MDYENMSEKQWRRQVMEEFAEGRKCFVKIQESVQKIETSTSLARNVQVFSDATGIVYRTVVKCSMPFVKAVMLVVALFIFAYMITHGGALPVWSKPWLTFMERLL